MVIRAIRDGLSIAGVLLLAVTFVVGGSPGYDFYAYWSVDPADPYAVKEGFGAFHYAPLVWLAGPLKLVPWPLAYWIWFAILFSVLVWLRPTGRSSGWRSRPWRRSCTTATSTC